MNWFIRLSLWLGTVVAVQGGFVLGQEIPRPLYSSWERLPPAVHAPLGNRDAYQRYLTARHPGWRRFRSDHPGRWMVLWNEATGTPHRLIGEGAPLRFPGGAPSRNSPAGDPDLEEAALALFGEYPELFPVDPRQDLRLEMVRDLGRLRLARFTQHHSGLPVVGGRCDLVATADGRAVLIASDVIPAAMLADLDPEPAIGERQAIDIARGSAGGPDSLGYRPPATRLVIVPARVTPECRFHSPSPVGPSTPGAALRPCLAWEVSAATFESGPAWRIFIAASPFAGRAAGAVLGRFDLKSYAEAAEGAAPEIEILGNAQGLGSPGLYPDVPWNPPISQPIENLRIWGGDRWTITAPDGSFAICLPAGTAATLRGSLTGPFCRIDNAAGEEARFTIEAAPGMPATISLNVPPSESTTAQINAFLAVNQAHDFVKSIDPGFAAIDQPVLALVNLEGGCNAFFFPKGEGILGFHRSGPCVNTAYSTMVFHEYGHLVSWKAFGDRPIMPAYNEGMADVLSMLMTDQPVVGASINGGPGAEGAALRDLSKVDLRYPGDVLREPHRSGLILGGALWRLRGLLIEKLGLDAGRDVLERLYVDSLFLAPAAISPAIPLDLLTLDDDDGNIFNGTPNGRDILLAFSEFGLAPPGELEIRHAALADTASGGPFAVEAAVSSSFDFIIPAEVLLHWSADGGNFQTVRMEPSSPAGTFRSEIPAQPPGITVKYWIAAAGDPLGSAVLPDGAPREETFVFAVGETRRLYFDTVGDDDGGWTHGIIPNGNPGNLDDWERGAIRPGIWNPGALMGGDLLDPTAAFSPPFHWGNDLALDGTTDKNYPDLAHNYLLSPTIDCRGAFGVRLRFRRCLTAERYDRMRILVNNTVVYQSPSSRDTFDRSWRLLDYDISGLADDREGVRIRFEMRSNSYGNAGGWNIDDIELIATGMPPSPRPVVTSIEPTFDSIRGGAGFILRGDNFAPTAETRVLFGETAATEVAVADGATITGRIPPGTQFGTADLTVITPGGTAILPGSFTYFGPPSIEAIIPAKASITGGAWIGLQGRYFTPDGTTAIWVGGRRVESIQFIDFRVVAGTLPPGRDIGDAEVRVETTFGDGAFRGLFTYTAPPSIIFIAPVSGLLEGGYPFTIFGNYYPSEDGAVKVLFGARAAEGIEVHDRRTLTGIVPAGRAKGPVDVRVETPGGAVILAGGFTYRVAGEPVFIRGDSNLDAFTDLTDAISFLGVLFLGDGDLPCQDAADTNDDGVLDISDPIYLLAFLFTGGPAPPLPFPRPGPDPTPSDRLGCASSLGEN